MTVASAAATGYDPGRPEPFPPTALTLFFCLPFLLMPLPGYVNAAAAGDRVNRFRFFSIPPRLPANGRLAQVAIAVHFVDQYLVYLFVALRIAGVLLQAVIMRDSLPDRMLPARR